MRGRSINLGRNLTGHPTWMAWMRHNGIDPNDVCLDPGYLVLDEHAGNVTVLTYVKDDHGELIVQGKDDVQRVERTYPLAEPRIPPPF